MVKKKEAYLGDQVRDDISGLVGIVEGMNTWLNGCVRMGIRPKIKKGEVANSETQWVDSHQVSVVKACVIKPAKLQQTPVGLGDQVKDQIVGFAGIAVAQSASISGDVQIAIQPKKKSGDKDAPTSQWFPCAYITIVKKNAFPKSKKPTEGPKLDHRKRCDPKL
jgi:hypothetical protein